jgi:cysteine-rich repeat protein
MNRQWSSFARSAVVAGQTLDGQGVRLNRALACLLLPVLLYSACAETVSTTPDATSDTGTDGTDGTDGSADPGDATTGDAGADTENDSDQADVAPDVVPDVEEPPAPFCGDGNVDEGEECDDALDNSNTVPDACRRDCSLAGCGDGVVDSGEACDDGNTEDSDFCSNSCAANLGDICGDCDDDGQCGGEFDACVQLGDLGYCGLSCVAPEDCPRGFECRDGRSTAGAATRQCIPSSGGCEGCFDPDRDGYGIGPECEGLDCRPNDGDIYPGATEVCDGVDNNCNGTVDEGLGLTDFYPDTDGDGVGAIVSPTQACAAPEGFVAATGDCDDEDRRTYPDAPELCDGEDNDCDDEIDNGAVPRNFWPDRDNDGFGDVNATPTESCAPLAGASTVGNDCNDGNAAVQPGVAESCSNSIDDNCDGQRDCADVTCAATPFCTCGDDSLEPNDEMRVATDAARSPFTNLRSCGDDADLFRVALGVGDVVEVSLNHVVAEGDIDVGLMNSDGEIVTGSFTEGPSETFSYAAAVAQDYFVIVSLYEDAGSTSGNTYSLTINVTEGDTGCTDDGNEPDDTLRTFRRGAPGTLSSLRACAGDADVTGIALNYGDTLTASLDFRHSEGDIDLIIVDPFGDEVAFSDSLTDDETASWTAEVGGTHFVIAILYDDLGTSAGNTYALSIEVDVAATACRSDAREENDSPLDAPELGAGTVSGLFSCENDADFYRFNLAAGDTLTATITFDSDLGDLDLELLNATDGQLDSSTGVFDTETVEFEAVEAGEVFLHVYSFSGPGSGTAYSLEVAID